MLRVVLLVVLLVLLVVFILVVPSKRGCKQCVRIWESPKRTRKEVVAHDGDAEEQVKNAD